MKKSAYCDCHRWVNMEHAFRKQDSARASLRLVQSPGLYEPIDLLAGHLVVILFVAFVEGDKLLRAVHHPLDVDVALGEERREPLNLAHSSLLLLVFNFRAAWCSLTVPHYTATDRARPSLSLRESRRRRCHVCRCSTAYRVRAKYEGQEYRREGYDMRWVEER